MPLITESAQPVASQPKADLFEVTGINIRVAEGTVTIYWRKSLRVEGGAATEVARGSHVEQAATLGAMFPDGSRSYHQNLKELAYGRLQAAGVFPPGALA